MVSAPVAEQSSRKFHSPSGVRPVGDRDRADQRDHRGAEEHHAPEHQGEPVDREGAGRAGLARGAGATQNVRAPLAPEPGGEHGRRPPRRARSASPGTRAARRLRGGPAKASTSRTTTRPRRARGAGRPPPSRCPGSRSRQAPRRTDRAAVATGPSSSPGATPSTRMSTTSGDQVSHSATVDVAAHDAGHRRAGVDLGGGQLDRRDVLVDRAYGGRGALEHAAHQREEVRRGEDHAERRRSPPARRRCRSGSPSAG